MFGRFKILADCPVIDSNWVSEFIPLDATKLDSFRRRSELIARKFSIFWGSIFVRVET